MQNYVFYDDTDCGGIVYHANYIIFCERARSLIFFENNILPHDSTQGFVVKEMQSRFLSSLKLGDKYEVVTKLLELKNTSMLLEQEIYKIGNVKEQQTQRTLAFSLTIKLAYIDIAQKKSCKIPHSITAFITTYIESKGDATSH